MRSALVLMLVAASAWQASAQGAGPAPLDPAIVSGRLDNGLTYYIRHNEKPKGQADFYIAQRVGSILEEEDQRGLAHFLEHMCFNGTENFPGMQIREWLDSKGVKFGADLNAATGVDQTVYNISSVPVAGNTAVQDSCLLILRDWSCAVTLDSLEIENERGVIHEEWRMSMSPAMRIFEKTLPILYPDNRYGERLPIGTMEVVDNFPRQAIVDYYHKWYRPDLQAIIVVGDIDPVYIEGKIKEIFGSIPAPVDPAERVYYTVDETPGTICAVGADKEMQMPVVLMTFKSDQVQLPREQRNTDIYYAVNYPMTMIEMMLNQRLSDLANLPETEFAGASIEIGSALLANTQGAINLEVYAKDTDVVPALAQAYRELLRAVRGGFTVGEYERARQEYISRLEKAYLNRNDVLNGAYSKELVDLFVDNIPAPGIEYEKQKIEQFAQMIDVEQINQILPGVIGEDNRLLLAMVPEKENFPIPTEDQFAEALAAVDAETIEPYKDEMRTDPLIPNLPAPGNIASVSHSDKWDADIYTLSNGVKVMVKKTDFKTDEIVFEAMAKGNNAIDPAKASSVKFAALSEQYSGLNDYSNSDLRKYMQGKQAGVGFGFDTYSRNLSGHTTVKDLPTLMELIYSYFTGFNIKEDEFTANRDAFAGIMANQESDPQFVFGKKLQETLFKSPVKHALTSADIKSADRADIIEMIRAMMNNAAEYTFVFVGNIDTATFVPLMQQYLATLPSDPDAAEATTFVANPDYEMAGGTLTDTFATPMETPQTWGFIGISGNMPYTAENKLLASVAAQIASKRLIEKIREEMQATYSLGAAADMMRLGNVNTIFQVAFPMKPELKDAALTEIHNILFNMMPGSDSPITEAELKPVLEYMTKVTEENRKDNSEWAGSMTATTLNGVDVFNARADVIPTITVEKVEQFMQALLNQNNYRVILVEAEAK